MTETPHWTTHFPEFAGNPFIARLPGPQSIKEHLATLRQLPYFKSSERSLDPKYRRLFASRVLNYMDPLTRQGTLVERLRTTIYQGYVDRNPADSRFRQSLLESADQLAEIQGGGVYDRLFTPTRSGGVPGFALLGCPGMGKSLTIDRALAAYPQAIRHDLSATVTQVPILKIECPSTGLRKNLCLDILTALGNILRRDLVRLAGGARATVDTLMMQVQHQALLCGLGVLIVDEIQHVNASTEGPERLVNFLVTLANRLGLPIVLVGTMGAERILQVDFRGARRAAGVGCPHWDRLQPGPHWDAFVKGMWKYQWCRDFTPLDDALSQVLYDESQGVIDVVVKLFYLAQTHLIVLSDLRDQTTEERLTPELIRRVSSDELYLVKPMIEALRRNDQAALAKFTDLKPLHRYVLETVRSAELVGGRDLAGSLAVEEAARAQSGKGSDHEEALRAILVGFDVPSGEQDALIQAAYAAAPSQDLNTVCKTLAALLSRKIPPSKKPRRSYNPNYIDGDLRQILTEAKKRGQSGYEALLDTGVIKDPVAGIAG